MTLHTLQITASSTIGAGNTAVNTYHFHPDSGNVWAGTNRVTVANQLITALKNMYTSWGTAGLINAYTIGGVVIEYERGQAPIYVGATPQTSTGANGVAVPYQVAAVCTWRTALAGKSYRGRSYVGPALLTSCGGQAWTSAYITALNAAVGTFLTAVAATPFDLCIASEVQNSSESVITGSFSNALRTMRSRAN